MKLARSSGILLHPTSLPGRFGIGDFGPAAYRFADFLAGSSQHVWQMLPLGPTGYGDSPYQCFSAFAGNPLLISLEKLVEMGILSSKDLEGAPQFPAHEVDYGRVIDFKVGLLKKAYHNFKSEASESGRGDLEAFSRINAWWLDDYSLFMAVKEAHAAAVWTRWDAPIAMRHPEAVERWNRELADKVEARKFWQYLFFTQWDALKRYCHDRGIRIMGDIPIFVAHDSADVWGHRKLFSLDDHGNPHIVAGVPPDYFSATGQLWGNPLYRWNVIARTGYKWWVDRFRAILSLVDIIRLDHFRGFEAYWEIPAAETTAIHGRWVKGPGAKLFKALQKALGELPIVAENLGVITPEVEQLRNQFGFPGMAVLQFAFGTDPQAPGFRPHNYPRNCVVYTGTHDNDTTMGWWTSAGTTDSTRSSEDIRRERDFTLKFLGTDGAEMNWVFIRRVLASVADLAMIPLQDVLGLGSEARMNLPSRPHGNWRWRFTSDMLTDQIRERLKELTVIYDRGN
ncbi:MAG: 4-alpha-glucanotransferase [Acidobacteriia bacterium]|nr:4-alpha-glucanotransferase [Terriglobia bacterium]